MTTPRDLLIVAIDMESSHPVEQGDLSLALAGAEVIDLLGAQVIRLDGDHIVPGEQPALADHLLDEAAASLVREAPYESVADWLWRRGRGLSAAYQAALEAEGQLIRQPRRGISFRSGQLVLVDSPARHQAADRWASDEPVLVTLAEAVGVRGKRTGDSPDVADDTVATVLAAVNDTLVELAAVRQRRSIEDAAFDNIWRGGAG
ncbi:GPP34 family phosphoprotein [Streptomyces sp. NBC_00555]|uniref:GOLPH3/VPS74 family protein n=1 Tax=Streptomyces sp. NBC_00555 TaxID=2903662 RepID=UPI00225A56D1|nr:GPP34 family phosphoprotein [Streptomyces sp. NBC_00555]MCX5009747.1 GPP34 family phosphoprotein [Streptomyces sp. NBC_00555]